MAAKKSPKTKSVSEIVSAYMTYVLDHEERPVSVYKFCKSVGVTEKDFYQSFGSMQSLQKEVWKMFFENTIEVLHKNEEYEQYGNKDKMLSFFFTFFEVLTLNRSYVLFSLSENRMSLKDLDQLKGLRKRILEFAKELIEDGNAEKAFKISRHNPTLFSEGAWLQTLFLLKFWMADSSPGFEKTDLAIEKSVQTIFDVFDNTPLDSLLDFGKFLFKENMA
ncbi:DNA-binding transcriptional regulator, AcrR family [Muriicola jejuensis]|uniref:TetR/AcrR family transcriptional regulator n=1 Tax=Muriicola jejuensis TaxID=504488 RepID=A0A6P0UB85_9FLAO|nr:TetR family transcriptional regulator C-terminal domain-containing protein [Muriicola jejuensis]NER09159.1 TetR/AcrR family transcriptional regulator [Muriicola jejuensis]SMP10711.1 DNA-binding transcriptional regulator, AcrR family [Muriicola jejuensis]